MAVAIARLESARLVLDPLRVEHADEMAPVLDDQALYEFTGGRPPTREELRRRFASQVAGRSPDGRARWLNWTVRLRATGRAVGTAQATVWTDDAGDLKSPPLESSQVSGQGELAAIGAVTGLGLLCLCALIIVRHAVNRRRMAAWEAAWVGTARVWNRQRW